METMKIKLNKTCDTLLTLSRSVGRATREARGAIRTTAPGGAEGWRNQGGADWLTSRGGVKGSERGFLCQDGAGNLKT